MEVFFCFSHSDRSFYHYLVLKTLCLLGVSAHGVRPPMAVQKAVYLGVTGAADFSFASSGWHRPGKRCGRGFQSFSGLGPSSGWLEHLELSWIWESSENRIKVSKSLCLAGWKGKKRGAEGRERTLWQLHPHRLFHLIPTNWDRKSVV